MQNETDAERLSPRVLAQAVLIALVWGCNFVAIKVGVRDVPPLALATLRFILSAFPAVLLLPRPRASWGMLAAYGLILGVGEFGLLFTAIKLGAPAGLASILLQSQAFFTALLAAGFLKERLKASSVLGMLVGALGLAILAWGGFTGSLAGAGSGDAPRLPLVLLGMILLAALSWAGANVLARKMPEAGGLGLVVWSSLFSPLPLAALSLLLEGPATVGAALATLGPAAIASLAYLVLLSTLLGYGLWNRLIMRHGAGKIAPFSLLVPVFGVAATGLLLGERLNGRDLLGAAFILGGLLIHVFGGRLRRA